MKETKKKFPLGKLVIAIVIVLIVAAMVDPALLFFLNEEQQAVIADFQYTYFTRHMPVQTGDGGFDAMSLVALAVLIAECWVVSFVVKLINQNLKLKNRHAETIKSLLCNCLKYVVVIYGIVFGLSILGVNMVAVIASLGVLGLIVGFGAQTLIEDVITGLFIIFEGQFHVGDIIAIDNYRGTVTSIGIRTTQITDAGGNIKVINNSDIRTLVNLSEVASVAIADVGISYAADLEKAEKVVNELCDALPSTYPGVFHDKPTFAGVQELADSAVVLRVSANVGEPDIYAARRILLRELKLAFDRSGIEIPFPQVVVHQGGGLPGRAVAPGPPCRGGTPARG